MSNWLSSFPAIYGRGALIVCLLSGTLLCSPFVQTDPPDTLESVAERLYFGGPITGDFKLCGSTRLLAPETSFVMLRQKFCHEDWRRESVVLTVFPNGPRGKTLQISSPSSKELKARWLENQNPQNSLLFVVEDHSPAGAAEITASIFLVEQENVERIFHHGLVQAHSGACNWYWNELAIHDSSSALRIAFTIRAFRDVDRFCFQPQIPDNGPFPPEKGLRTEIRFEYRNGQLLPDKPLPDYRTYISAKPL